MTIRPKTETGHAEFNGYDYSIPLVTERCPSDVFENAIRTIGPVAACEWFGYAADSEFTKETIRVLRERSEIDVSEQQGCA